MAVRTDFLETRPVPVQQAPDLTETNRLLKALLAETRKNVPKLRCVTYVTEGNIRAADGVNLAANNKPVIVRFLNEGNTVKSFYTIVVNGGSSPVSVTINEPNITAPGTVNTGNGIYLIAQGSPLILPNVEIEFLSISSSSTSGIPVNYGDPTQAVGMIMVWGWTLQEYANITE